MDSGIACTSVCINAAISLPVLVSQCLEDGLVSKRRVFEYTMDAVKTDVQLDETAADSVVNCT